VRKGVFACGTGGADKLALPRINRRQRPSQIVAADALSVAQIELGLPPRPEDRGGLGTDHAFGGRTRIGGERARIRAVKGVLAQSGDGADLVGPLRPVLDIEATARLDHVVVADGEAHHVAGGLGEPYMDVVEAGIEADGAGGGPPEQLPNAV
jgi:hypothetical protein